MTTTERLKQDYDEKVSAHKAATEAREAAEKALREAEAAGEQVGKWYRLSADDGDKQHLYFNAGEWMLAMGRRRTSKLRLSSSDFMEIPASEALPIAQASLGEIAKAVGLKLTTGDSLTPVPITNDEADSSGYLAGTEPIKPALPPGYGPLPEGWEYRGEFRLPKKDEWYIGGGTYQAAMDYTINEWPIIYRTTPASPPASEPAPASTVNETPSAPAQTTDDWAEKAAEDFVRPGACGQYFTLQTKNVGGYAIGLAHGSSVEWDVRYMRGQVASLLRSVVAERTKTARAEVWEKAITVVSAHESSWGNASPEVVRRALRAAAKEDAK